MDLKEFVLENNTPIVNLDCKEAFGKLTEKEKKYLHHYTKVNIRHFQQIQLSVMNYLYFPLLLRPVTMDP